MPEAPIGPKPKSAANLKTLITVLLLVAAIGSSIYLFQQYRKTQKELANIKQNPNQLAQQESKELITKVGRFIELPTGEDPTVATITDIDKLKDQPFFAKAKNGDKILIYANAKKAYLYSPSADKLLDVAPLSIGTPSATPASPTPSPKK